MCTSVLPPLQSIVFMTHAGADFWFCGTTSREEGKTHFPSFFLLLFSTEIIFFHLLFSPSLCLFLSALGTRDSRVSGFVPAFSVSGSGSVFSSFYYWRLMLILAIVVFSSLLFRTNECAVCLCVCVSVPLSSWFPRNF